MRGSTPGNISSGNLACERDVTDLLRFCARDSNDVCDGGQLFRFRVTVASFPGRVLGTRLDIQLTNL